MAISTPKPFSYKQGRYQVFACFLFPHGSVTLESNFKLKNKDQHSLGKLKS